MMLVSLSVSVVVNSVKLDSISVVYDWLALEMARNWSADSWSPTPTCVQQINNMYGIRLTIKRQLLKDKQIYCPLPKNV